MAKARRLKNAWVLWVIALATVGITVAAELTAPVANPLGAAIRGLALTGYQLIFWAIVSSAYVPQLVRFFGRPFIKIHHLASVTGLVCITLHPILVAVDSRSAGVFLPRFDSVQVFLQLGGAAGVVPHRPGGRGGSAAAAPRRGMAGGAHGELRGVRPGDGPREPAGRQLPIARAARRVMGSPGRNGGRLRTEAIRGKAQRPPQGMSTREQVRTKF